MATGVDPDGTSPSRFTTDECRPLAPLSFDRAGEALLPSIATTNVYRLNVPTRQVAGPGVARLQRRSQ